MPSVLESNEDEPTGADEHFEPVWRRLDDILTMAQPFDVVGFGQVRCLPLPTLRSDSSSAAHLFAALGWGGACAPPHPHPQPGAERKPTQSGNEHTH